MPVTIPKYPVTRPLNLADKVLFQEHFSVLQPVISEFSFANLFLFRHVHRYTVTCIADSLIVFGYGYDGSPYFLPPLSGDRGEVARKLLQEGQLLYGADEQFVKEYLAGGEFAAESDRDNDDYLYLRSELVELPGNRFHTKKNRISYFSSRNNYTIEPFSERHLRGAQQLLDEWQRIYGAGARSSLLAETAAAREGLELAGELGLYGVVVLTAAGIAAFALGEQLNETTTVCHFEKANPFMEGAAQLVNREFSREQFVNCTYINREQDLGVSGLRAAKSSYHPAAMIRKFIVRHSENPGLAA